MNYIMSLDQIINKILADETIEKREIINVISNVSVTKRYEANYKIAEAFQSVSKFKKAKIYIDRAFTLSGFDEKIYKLYYEIHSKLKDTESIREALKRRFINEADNRNIEAAAYLFDKWLYVYAEEDKIDKYVYDYDVLAAFDRLVQNYNVKFINNPSVTAGSKIKIAYLIKDGIIKDGTLMKVMKHCAAYHDLEKFEVMFFLPESESVVNNSEGGRIHKQMLESFGWEVQTSPDIDELDSRLIHLAHSINSFNPHILVTTQGMANFVHYFISLLKPAPVILGLGLGNALEFSLSHKFDYSLIWPQTIQVNSPVNSAIFNMEIELPKREKLNPIAKESLGIPSTAKILMSVGRYPKFQDRKHWEAVIQVLEENNNIYFLVIGPKREEIPLLNSLKGYTAVSKRIILLGWQHYYFNYLAMADLVLDTYPMGGAIVMMDTMALGTPILTYKNDTISDNYEYSNATAAGELINIPELIIERDDFDLMKSKIKQILNNDEYRNSLGDKCKKEIYKINGNPERMVKNCEVIYEQLAHELPDNADYDLEISLKLKNSLDHLISSGEALLESSTNIELAIDIFNKVINIDPKNSSAKNNLGVAYWGLGKKFLALIYFSDAYHLEKANKTYLFNYVEASLELGFKKNMESIIQQYVTMKNNETESVI